MLDNSAQQTNAPGMCAIAPCMEAGCCRRLSVDGKPVNSGLPALPVDALTDIRDPYLYRYFR